jgi:two-component system chemotaxis response regulator CheY
MDPPRRILVVDDNGDMRRLNAEVLIDSGYEVEAAEDGAAAWRTLQAGHYDLLITDNNMPNVTGVELLQKLRAAHMDLPVIMATSELPDEEFIRSPWLQPAATLVKPYTVGELLGTVTEVLCAIESAREQTATPPNRQSEPSAKALQFR